MHKQVHVASMILGIADLSDMRRMCIELTESCRHNTSCRCCFSRNLSIQTPKSPRSCTAFMQHSMICIWHDKHMQTCSEDLQNFSPVASMTGITALGQVWCTDSAKAQPPILRWYMATVAIDGKDLSSCSCTEQPDGLIDFKAAKPKILSLAKCPAGQRVAWLALPD